MSDAGYWAIYWAGRANESRDQANRAFFRQRRDECVQTALKELDNALALTTLASTVTPLPIGMQIPLRTNRRG